MSTRKFVRIIGIVVGVLLILAGCGKSSEVGSDVGAAGGGGGDGALRDPKATTTQALDINDPGSPTTQAAKSAGIGAGNTPAAPKATTTTQAEVTEDTQASTTSTTQADDTYTVLIQDDQQGNFMQPLSIQVPAGQTITWKNVSTKVRKLQAQTGEFASPDIPAGGTFSWVVTAAPGTLTYKDTTRPYATAQIQVT